MISKFAPVPKAQAGAARKATSAATSSWREVRHLGFFRPRGARATGSEAGATTFASRP